MDVHASQIEELPDVIPPELYVRDLDCAEEQAAFAQLQDAEPADADPPDVVSTAMGASGMFHMLQNGCIDAPGTTPTGKYTLSYPYYG